MFSCPRQQAQSLGVDFHDHSAELLIVWRSQVGVFVEYRKRVSPCRAQQIEVR